MVWNAAGTFHTRLSATALTANRKFVFPDLDGTLVVSSAGSVAVDRISASSGNIVNIFSAGTLAVAGNATVLGTFTVSGNAVVGTLAVLGTLTVSGAAVVNGLTVAGTITASAAIVLNNLAVGGNFTVSGTAVIGNLTVPGRISASAGNVVVLSAGAVHTNLLVACRQNAVSEGGEIEWTRAADDVAQWAMDCVGAGSATANIFMRLFNANAGVPLFQWDLLGRFATGGVSSLTSPYDQNGSVVGPAGAAAKFDNTIKAWVAFTVVAGAVAIQQSFNVSGVSRASSGIYTVNLINAVSSSACLMDSVFKSTQLSFRVGANSTMSFSCIAADTLGFVDVEYASIGLLSK